MYEALWDQSPRVQQIRAEGRAEGEVQALRRILVQLVKARYPALADLAQQEAERMNKPDKFDMLVQQIAIADDEKMVRWLLKSVEK